MLFLSVGITSAVVTIAIMTYIFRGSFSAIPLPPMGKVRQLARAYSGALPNIVITTQASELSAFLGGGDLRLNPEHLISSDKLNLQSNFLLGPEFFNDSESLLEIYLPVVISGASTEKFGLANGSLAWVRKKTKSKPFRSGDIVLIKRQDGNQSKDYALKARRLYAKKAGSDSEWLTLAYATQQDSEPSVLAINHHSEDDFIGVFTHKVRDNGGARKFRPIPYSKISADLEQVNLEPLAA